MLPSSHCILLLPEIDRYETLEQDTTQALLISRCVHDRSLLQETVLLAYADVLVSLAAFVNILQQDVK